MRSLLWTTQAAGMGGELCIAYKAVNVHWAWVSAKIM